VPGSVLAWLVRGDEGREEPRQQQPTGVRRLLDPRLLDLALPVALLVAVVALSELIDAVVQPDLISVVWQGLLGLSLGLCLYFAYGNNRGVRFGLGIAAVIVAGTLTAGTGNVILQDRSFFGVYTVREDVEIAGYHTLVFGSTSHGAQFLEDAPTEPLTYYHRTGPIGQLFDALPNEDVKSRVGLIGLGTGTMACYNAPGQQWDFYEIDPLIERIARDPNLFTYLRDCPGETEVILGDARLSLRDTAPDGEYGMIVADAFSSDAIPVHLLTREAIDLYLDKLREDGVLAIHISNRHLALEPVLGDLARDRQLTCYAQFDGETEDFPGKSPAHWVAMAREPGDLGSVPNDGRWLPCETSPDPEEDVWTDDFSNLLSTFEWN
jgi:hypothetical protein